MRDVLAAVAVALIVVGIPFMVYSATPQPPPAPQAQAQQDEPMSAKYKAALDSLTSVLVNVTMVQTAPNTYRGLTMAEMDAVKQNIVLLQACIAEVKDREDKAKATPAPEKK